MQEKTALNCSLTLVIMAHAVYHHSLTQIIVANTMRNHSLTPYYWYADRHEEKKYIFLQQSAYRCLM